MSIEPKHVELLIKALAEQVGASLVFKGFLRMSDEIPAGVKKSDKQGLLITQRYLYDTFKRAQKRSVNTRFSESHLDLIAVAIGKRNFRDFVLEVERPIDPVIKGCIGKWWSIVRANSGAYLLKAPVRIFLNEGETDILIELQGGQRSFSGKVTLRAGNIFCELDTGRDKKLYIVMKVGTSESPLLLQGTFAGISSAGDPIAGRELFVREEKLSFEEMKWEKLPVGANNLDARINQYFGTYEGNCLKIGQVSTFSQSDLDTINPTK